MRRTHARNRWRSPFDRARYDEEHLGAASGGADAKTRRDGVPEAFLGLVGFEVSDGGCDGSFAGHSGVAERFPLIGTVVVTSSDYCNRCRSERASSNDGCTADTPQASAIAVGYPSSDRRSNVGKISPTVPRSVSVGGRSVPRTGYRTRIVAISLEPKFGMHSSVSSIGCTPSRPGATGVPVDYPAAPRRSPPLPHPSRRVSSPPKCCRQKPTHCCQSLPLSPWQLIGATRSQAGAAIRSPLAHSVSPSLSSPD